MSANKKSANKEYTQAKINIDGIDYVLQMVPASWYLDWVDKCKDTDGSLKTQKYIGGLLENCVISPKVTIDSFTGNIRKLRDLNDVVEKYIMGDEVDGLKNVSAPETPTTPKE